MSARAKRSPARLAVDIGGTFTDVVLHAGRQQWTTKVLTTPHAPEDGVIQSVTEILAQARLPAAGLGLFILGTTLATNALIERKGAVTALITTAGFRDIYEIANEYRFAQYDIFLEKPEPLVPRRLRITVPERVNSKGEVLLALDDAAVEALVPFLRDEGVQSAAVAFLHSYANPAHEQRVREILRGHAPDLFVTLSSDVCPEIREYERISTACANAYVQPVMAGYLRRLESRLRSLGMACPLYLMTSGGAITTLAMGAEQPVRLVESGPAGGAILSREIAAQCGERKVLSYDMGGTTAKICFIDDYTPQLSRTFEFGRVYRFLKGSGLPIRIPVIEMVEIGAGGGSIARVDALQRVVIGPDSAGSDPGPACYAQGGVRATVTDADCVLGLLDVERFAGGKLRLDAAAARAAVHADVGVPLATNAALGALAVSEIVCENMANAARVHAMELGKTVEDYSVIAFGGAAPLHAARLADKLGVSRVIVPQGAGVGSALGFLWAPVAYQALRSWYQSLATLDLARANRLLSDMQRDAVAIVREAAPGGALGETRTAYMRYIGQGHEIPVALANRALTSADVPRLKAHFERCYTRFYGRTIPHLGVEILSWSVLVSTRARARERARSRAGKSTPKPAGRREIFDAGKLEMRRVPVYERTALEPGAHLRGPALVVEDQTTIVIENGFDAHVNSLGYLIMDRRRSRPRTNK